MPSTPPSNANRGFSLVELLVATTVMSAVLAAAGVFFVAARTTITDQILRIETLQGLRAAMDEMVRDLRLGGACLPMVGDFVTIDATNSGTDRIFTRTGLVRPNETCVSTTLASPVNASATSMTVANASGFTPNMRIYLWDSNATSGEVLNITTVNASTNVLGKTTTLTCPHEGGCNTPAYNTGAAVYAVDERYYYVDTTSNPSLPVLMLGVNGGTATPFAFGIENLQIQYELNRNCDTSNGCDVVDLPANDTEWSLVNQIYLTLSARSRTVTSSGQYYRVSRTVSAKPRNLIQ